MEKVIPLDGEPAGMQRRTLLRSAVPTLVLGLAGCSGTSDGGDGTETATSGSDMVNIEPIEQSGEDLDGDPITELTVEYDARTEFVVNPDEAGVLEAEEGTVNLVFQFRVTNAGDQPVDVAPDMFQVADNDRGVFPDYDTDDPDQFPERRLDPDDVANGWIAYQIRALASKILVVVRQSYFDGGVVTSFEQNTDLEFTITNEDTGTTVPPDDT